MADITLSSRTLIRPFRSAAGSHRIFTFDASTCASGAQIKCGQLVQFDTTSSATHRVVRSSTGTTPLLSTNIVGVAAQDDTSDGSTLGLGEGKRQISIWGGVGEFLFPTNIAGTASTLVNTALAVKWDSTLGIHYLVANSSAADQFVLVTEVVGVGDTNGFVAGRIQSTRIAPAIANRG